MMPDQQFSKLPVDLQRFLIDLQIQERVTDLCEQYKKENGDLNERESALFHKAYRHGLSDGLIETHQIDLKDFTVIDFEPDNWKLIADHTLKAVLLEYQAMDQALDQLISLMGRSLHFMPLEKDYRLKMNEILNELSVKILKYRSGAPTKEA